MEKIIVAAVADNLIIGDSDKLPWSMPADKVFFRTAVEGQWLIMGRRTFESAAIEGTIPGTYSLVISRKEDYKVESGQRVSSLEDGIQIAMNAGKDKLFILGGGQIYAQGIEIADRLIITEIHTNPNGDTHFPEIDPEKWREDKRSEFTSDDKNPFDYAFVEYIRR